ncbi:SDR family NAD(P)-dependent oxidoreductase [Caldimonas sp. KR1-144]|uniref:SDR family NAD(P)-dependent oxidoreductase n=1 Tax=Caldimonas sp. KR1-144 TaxID=3400911 RepID=UPI003C0E457E
MASTLPSPQPSPARGRGSDPASSSLAPAGGEGRGEGVFANRHVVVTGGGSGIGAAIARAFASQGAMVTVMGRRTEALQAVVKLGGQVHAVVCDVTDEASVVQAFEAAHERAPVDTLVNNAGAVETAPLARTSATQWRRALDVNLTGAFLCQQQVLPGMAERRFGRVINVASTAGLKGYAYVAPYVAAKHGLVGLTRAAALELAKTGVTVNAVCPGYTDTEIVREAIDKIVRKTGRDEAAARAALEASNPQGRLVKPEEVAQAVLWLAREDSAAITGQAIAVAGGEVM